MSYNTILARQASNRKGEGAIHPPLESRGFLASLGKYPDEAPLLELWG